MSESSGPDRIPSSDSATSAHDEPPLGYSSLKERYRQNRNFDMNATWREWLRQRYAKGWYAIGSLLLDGIIVGLVFQNMDSSQAWPYLVSALLVVGLTYAEIRGLRHFWPPKSPP